MVPLQFEGEHLTIINDRSQNVAAFLAGMSVVGQTLQVPEAGGPLGAGRTFAGLVFHTGLLTVSPTRTRPAYEEMNINTSKYMN